MQYFKTDYTVLNLIKSKLKKQDTKNEITSLEQSCLIF